MTAGGRSPHRSQPGSREGFEGIGGHVLWVSVDPLRLGPRQREAMTHVEALIRTLPRPRSSRDPGHYEEQRSALRPHAGPEVYDIIMSRPRPSHTQDQVGEAHFQRKIKEKGRRDRGLLYSRKR